MSGINAISKSDVGFRGIRKNEKSRKNQGTSPFITQKPRLRDRLTAPIRADFRRKYNGAEPTASLVADYIADKVLKAGVAVAGFVFFVVKAKKCTNGFTESLVGNLKEAFKKGTDSTKRTGILKSSINLVKDTISGIKENNLTDAINKSSAQKAGTEGTHILNSLEYAFFRPKKFNEASKLGVVVDKASEIISKGAKKIGINSSKADKEAISKVLKTGAGKIGISNGYEVVDAAIVGASARAFTHGANDVADDVTSKDDKKLAHEANAKKIVRFLDAAQKIADSELLDFAG